MSGKIVCQINLLFLSLIAWVNYWKNSSELCLSYIFNYSFLIRLLWKFEVAAILLILYLLKSFNSVLKKTRIVLMHNENAKLPVLFTLDIFSVRIFWKLTILNSSHNLINDVRSLNSVEYSKLIVSKASKPLINLKTVPYVEFSLVIFCSSYLPAGNFNSSRPCCRTRRLSFFIHVRLNREVLESAEDHAETSYPNFDGACRGGDVQRSWSAYHTFRS